MKFLNYFIFILIALFLAANLGACEGKAKESKTGTFLVESAYIREEGNHLMINAEYPILSGFPQSEELNAEIEGRVEAAADEVRNAAQELEGREGFVAFLNSSYQYFNNKNIASIWINFDNYTGGAHGLYWINSYTLNTETGQIYTFPQLFADGKDGVEYVTKKILKEVSESDKEYFENAKNTIVDYGGNYNFLINGDKLVVYFPLYDIAPYVAGIRSFNFSTKELEGLLKPEVAEAMRDQEEQPIPFLNR
jgi:hypothetical protein